MTPPDFTTLRWGLTPRKLAIVAALALVLTIVLFAQFSSPTTAGKGANNGDSDASSSRQPRARPPAPAQAAAPVESLARARRPWPQILRQEIEQHNPFRTPKRLASSGRSAGESPQTAGQEQTQQTAARKQAADAAEQQRQRQDFLGSLRKQGVTLIMESGGEKVAYIGPLCLRVGQEVKGFRVTEIGRDGVILEEAGGQ
jgi:parvulin-like peptidyl-prolyl isomerase